MGGPSRSRRDMVQVVARASLRGVEISLLRSSREGCVDGARPARAVKPCVLSSSVSFALLSTLAFTVFQALSRDPGVLSARIRCPAGTTFSSVHFVGDPASSTMCAASLGVDDAGSAPHARWEVSESDSAEVASATIAPLGVTPKLRAMITSHQFQGIAPAAAAASISAPGAGTSVASIVRILISSRSLLPARPRDMMCVRC